MSQIGATPSDDDLFNEMLRDEKPQDEPGTLPPEILERGGTELVGIPGEHLVLREDGRTRFEALARGPEQGEHWDRKRLCVGVRHVPAPSDRAATETFRSVLASLSSKRPPAPPRGFMRLPFGEAHAVDVPVEMLLHEADFKGPDGRIFAFTPYRAPTDLSALLVGQPTSNQIAAKESHADQPFLDGAFDEARVRYTDPALDWRAALVRLPKQKPVLFTSKLKAGASASALDDGGWVELIRALAPMFEREDVPRGDTESGG